jgi:hypothetical protein
VEPLTKGIEALRAARRSKTMTITFAQAAPWIMFYESSMRNVRNAAGSSASGYFQIIKTTWNQFRAHVPDAAAFAEAIDAPYPIQYAVAAAVFAGQGLDAWAVAPKVRAHFPGGV